MKPEELGNAILRVVSAIGSAVAAVLALVMLLQSEAQRVNVPDEEVITRGSGYNTPCYFEQGGAVLSADSGCSIRIESGATLTTANGATFSPNNLSAVYLTATTALQAQAATITGSVSASTISAAYVTATTALQAQAATITGSVSAYALTGTASISTPLLYVEGVAASGPVRFGSASTVISGTTIAHGLATTPTSFILQNAVIQAATFTQTLYSYGCNVTSCTVGLSEGDVITFTTVNWMAGR